MLSRCSYYRAPPIVCPGKFQFQRDRSTGPLKTGWFHRTMGVIPMDKIISLDKGAVTYKVSLSEVMFSSCTFVRLRQRCIFTCTLCFACVSQFVTKCRWNVVHELWNVTSHVQAEETEETYTRPIEKVHHTDVCPRKENSLLGNQLNWWCIMT